MSNFDVNLMSYLDYILKWQGGNLDIDVEVTLDYLS